MAAILETRHGLDSERQLSFESGKEMFCPHGGRVGFDDEQRHLLMRRLRIVALILFGGFLAFLIRNMVSGAYTIIASPIVILAHFGVTAVLGLSAAFLTAKCTASMRTLRAIELIIFGIPAAYGFWATYQAMKGLDFDSFEFIASIMAEMMLPSVLLIQLYSLFIPNSLRRASIVITLFALIPLGATWLASLQNEMVAIALMSGGTSYIFLWMAVAAVAGIYGSHRFGRLRREAFEAAHFGAYSLRRKLGSGGMGEVYLAEHRLLKRPCAIKLIRSDIASDSKAALRFESEVRAAARMTHPNTIEIYDFGQTSDGTFYYAMEYLPGMTLQELVDRFGPLPPHRLVHLLRQVCGALREAHRAGLIHRDIKPGNIFVAERGGMYDVAKLLDFGLVKSMVQEPLSPEVTLDGVVVGSPAYAAPEAALDGVPDARSDIYSLGATAYFLLTGQPVFSGKNALKVLFAHAKEEVVLPSTIKPDVPADLEAVVMKCLEKDPSDRYADVTDLERDLAACSCTDCWTQEHAERWWSKAETSSEITQEPGAMQETVTVGRT